jgi:hypothetical protein
MTKQMTEGQRAYEAIRAKKAGVSLEKWLSQKEKERATEAREKEKASKPPAPPKPPGLLTRMLDKAHKPLGKKKA